jgi:hypothetical protein
MVYSIVLLPKSVVVQYYVADFSFWTLTFLCNLVLFRLVLCFSGTN